MDFLMDNLWALWLIIAAVMLFIEVTTTALVSIWFVFGAVATAVIASFWDNFVAQVIIFFLLSGVFLLLFRNLYKKKLKAGDRSKELNYSLIGKIGTVVDRITVNEGKVLIGDVYWKAVSDDNKEIPQDTVIVVSGENGTTLKVHAK